MDGKSGNGIRGDKLCPCHPERSEESCEIKSGMNFAKPAYMQFCVLARKKCLITA